MEISNLDTLPDLGSNPSSSTIFDSLALHPKPEVLNKKIKNKNSILDLDAPPDTHLELHNKNEHTVSSSGYNSSILSNSLQKSNFVTSNTQSSFHQDTNLVGEINFNFNLDQSESTEDTGFSSEEDDDFYDSCQNPDELEQLRIQESQDFVKVDIEEDYFKSSLSLRHNIIRNELPKSYVYIDIPPRK